MDVIIREADVDDINRVQEMAAALSSEEHEQYDGTIAPDWPLGDDAGAWFRDRMEGDDGLVRLAEVVGEVVGYIVAGVDGAEEYRSIEAIAEVETMYVEPEYRGNGIGTRFLEAFFDWSRDQDVDRCRVEVTAGNEAGIRFYERNGFGEYAVTLETRPEWD